MEQRVVDEFDGDMRMWVGAEIWKGRVGVEQRDKGVVEILKSRWMVGVVGGIRGDQKVRPVEGTVLMDRRDS